MFWVDQITVFAVIATFSFGSHAPSPDPDPAVPPPPAPTLTADVDVEREDDQELEVSGSGAVPNSTVTLVGVVDVPTDGLGNFDEDISLFELQSLIIMFMCEVFVTDGVQTIKVPVGDCLLPSRRL